MEQYKNAVSGNGQSALLKKRTAETQESNLDAMQALTATSLPAKKRAGGGGLVQQSYQDSMCTSISQQMDVAVADLIYGDNLHFGFCDSIRFRKVMKLAKHLPTTYKFIDPEGILGDDGEYAECRFIISEATLEFSNKDGYTVTLKNTL